MNEERMIRMRELLERELEPTDLSITDDSHLHVGHPGAQDGRGHFTVQIASQQFQGADRIQCHRMVYAALGEMMTTDIHALRIIATVAPAREN